MSEPFNDEKQEEPLDPAMERVRIKLRRLLFGSSFIMILGLMAVFAAIFYKLNERSEPARASYQVPDVVTEADLRRASYSLPAGSTVTGVAIDGDRLAVTYSIKGQGNDAQGGGILLIDVSSWQVFSEMSLPQKQ